MIYPRPPSPVGRWGWVNEKPFLFPPLLFSCPDWDTERNLKQLQETAAWNSTEGPGWEKGVRTPDTCPASPPPLQPAAQMTQNMEKIRAEQKRMKTQDSELSQNLDGLLEDLSNLKSQGAPKLVCDHCPHPTTQGLNERHTALNSLERLQEEVAKLWIELRVSNGSKCNTCPEQWVNFQRKCYYFGEGAKRWIQARLACSKLQGRLVSIHSQEEQDFLAKSIHRRGSWIGLRDLNIEGDFVWMDENPLDYSNWRPGEPNDGGERGLGEDCVMMLSSGQWNDAFCGNQLDGWVCDRLATSPCPPTEHLSLSFCLSQSLGASFVSEGSQ
uniref:C-type lectin domain-containing protein n=1 Tax=Rhinolophus ferrumequinum TaxID=59479 RepID=A0A671F306_RHIFE